MASHVSQPVLQANPRLSSTLVPTQLVVQSPGSVQAPGLVQAPGYVQGVFQADPRFSSSGSPFPVQMAVQASGVPQVVQTGPALSSLSSGLPATGYSTVTYVPVDVGSDAGALQPGAGLSEPQGKSSAWSVDGPKYNAEKPKGLWVLLISPQASLAKLCYEGEIFCMWFELDICYRTCVLKQTLHKSAQVCNGSLLLEGKGLHFKQAYWGTKWNVSITP